jgi:pyruvate-formate lyase
MAATPITQEKVHKAKMSIENFYANLINQYEEREERYRRLEEMMDVEGLSEQEVRDKRETVGYAHSSFVFRNWKSVTRMLPRRRNIFV